MYYPLKGKTVFDLFVMWVKVWGEHILDGGITWVVSYVGLLIYHGLSMYLKNWDLGLYWIVYTISCGGWSKSIVYYKSTIFFCKWEFNLLIFVYIFSCTLVNKFIMIFFILINFILDDLHVVTSIYSCSSYAALYFINKKGKWGWLCHNFIYSENSQLYIWLKLKYIFQNKNK